MREEGGGLFGSRVVSVFPHNYEQGMCACFSKRGPVGDCTISTLWHLIEGFGGNFLCCRQKKRETSFSLAASSIASPLASSHRARPWTLA